nr:NAD-dependent epimerase/dehydratase family protein [Parahaliea mediterranea]
MVTGATGFIGGALCAHLREAAIELVPVSRSGASLADGSPTLAADLFAAQELLRGVDSVCHLAGIAHQRAASADYQRLNVDATLALARAAIEAGVRRFVFVSSVKAMGPAGGDSPRNESMVSAAGDAYGRSKWEAERGLLALCEASAMDLYILRPCLVYGPSPRGNLRLLARGARWGMPRPPAGGARSMVGLDDLTALLCQLLRGGPAGAHTWIVSDGQRYSARYLYDTLRGAMGRNPGPEWLPPLAWRAAATLLDRLLGQEAGATYDKLFGTELYDHGALSRDLGWRPRQTVADLAARMVASP